MYIKLIAIKLMKIKFSQKYLQTLFAKFLLLSTFFTFFYHVFFFLYERSNPTANKYLANILNTLITLLGFYFSIIPIKILSVLVPSWYDFTSSYKYPVSKSFWIFLIEQACVILFITLNLLVIYILLMWAKRLYYKFTTEKYHKPWSLRSKILGTICLVYYLFLLIMIFALASGLQG